MTVRDRRFVILLAKPMGIDASPASEHRESANQPYVYVMEARPEAENFASRP